ncbi:hypothetical protein [Nonomuraea turcica]|uniref:hypothetical protein n=1 Tax=Nonomuraea sp. G32 TaxID=3067274 RepID=UPI00273B033E|nr:hypothetical protein [Nonomuraea sp. G32]MDP4510107.1 hypothetical protein [Nonomuraea sp. G32]
MRKIARRAASLGATAVAAAAIGLVAAPSANAAMTWYTDPPTKASGVTTVATVSLPGGGSVQVRQGKYGNYTYVWGRVSSPTSKYNQGYALEFVVGGCNVSNGSKSRDIDRTTYTPAARRNKDCTYYAHVITHTGNKYIATASYNP